jgi:hypothetical protein
VIEARPYPAIALARSRSVHTIFGMLSAVGLSLGVIAALWLGGQGSLLRIAIPAVAMFVGLILYLSHPITYVQYTLWVWFLSPLVRRIVDLRFGFADPNLVLLAPLLVSAVAGLTLVIPSRRGNTRVPVVFLLCGVAIVYGFLVGILLHPSAETVYALFNWLCPMLFGLHLFLDWREYETYWAAVSRTFWWGVLLLGLYGVYQYFYTPEWDRYWLENIQVEGANSSFGELKPLQVRVWSTMNSPGPFANTMMVGLLLLLNVRSPLKAAAGAAGYFSFLLSVVRTAWLSWAVGVVLVVGGAKPRTLVKIFLLVVTVVICVLPLFADPRVAPLIENRFNTFTDLGHDDSFVSRIDMYGSLMNLSVHNPTGFGLSNQVNWHDTAIDSGILSLLFSLGWLGTLLFAAGLFHLLLMSGWRFKDRDRSVVVAGSIVIALLAQILSGPIFVGVTGAMFWMFAGMHLGAVRRSKFATLQTPNASRKIESRLADGWDPANLWNNA